MTTHVQRDAIAQTLWRLRSIPVRMGSRVAPSLMSRRSRGATLVHLGCGDNVIRGWANLDMSGPAGVTRFDLTRPLPFADQSVDFVYTEHFIEHLHKDQAERLLRECGRILRPGGVLRVSTPDLAVLVREYSKSRVTEWEDLGWTPATPADLLNEGMRLWGHLYVWDEGELRQALVGVGFAHMERMPWHESSQRILRGLETRPDHGDLIIDATR